MPSISLGRPYDEYMAAKLKSGEYGSIPELLRAALRLLQERDDERARWLTELDAKLDRAEMPKPGIPNEEALAYLQKIVMAKMGPATPAEEQPE